MISIDVFGLATAFNVCCCGWWPVVSVTRLCQISQFWAIFFKSWAQFFTAKNLPKVPKRLYNLFWLECIFSKAPIWALFDIIWRFFTKIWPHSLLFSCVCASKALFWFQTSWHRIFFPGVCGRHHEQVSAGLRLGVRQLQERQLRQEDEM
jgi:hypothetical protein